MKTMMNLYISCSGKKFEIERRDESFYQRCSNCFNGKDIEMNIKPWLHLENDPKIPIQIKNINNWTEIYQRYKTGFLFKTCISCSSDDWDLEINDEIIFKINH